MNISIIIPTYNEETTIERCLKYLTNSIEYSKSIYPTSEYNVILCDSSKDKTPDIASKYLYTTVLNLPKKGIPIARDTGTLYAISHLNSDIIISNDADTIAPYDWLYKILTHFYNDKNLIAITGIYKNLSDSIYESLSTHISNNIFIGLGGNTAFKSHAYLQIGGYNTSISSSEDIDLFSRFKHLGKTIFDKNLYIIHDAGYRWRAATSIPLSLLFSLIGYNIPNLVFMKNLGLGMCTYEILKNGAKFKTIPYNQL